MNDPEQIQRRNFRVHFAEGSLYMASLALLNPQTVYPALLRRLGASDLTIGLLPVVVYAAYFIPQVLAAHAAGRMPYRKPFVVATSLAQRLQILLLAIVIMLFGGSYPGFTLILFFLIFTANQIVAGLSAPVWYDLVAKTVPPTRRGKLMGLRTSTGSVLGFANSLLLTGLLSLLVFPYNYGIVILIAFALQFGSWLILRQTTETEPSPVSPPVPLSELVPRIRGILAQDRRFRMFLLSAAFSTVGLMSAAFFVVSALDRFRLPETFVGIFTMIMVSTQVLSASALGWVSDRWGTKKSLLVCASAMTVASGIALFARDPAWYYVVFVLTGITFGAELITRFHFAAERAPQNDRAMYVAVMNGFLAPFYLFSILGGWISDVAGYPVVFGVGMVFSLSGLLLLLRVQDPRCDVKTSSPSA
jgi:MFS family permease